MKAYLEIVELKVNDVVTASGEEECCDYGCPNFMDQIAGNW